MKRLLAIMAILALAGWAWGTTQTAASVSLADVTTAYGLCTTGDTLAIPAGSATWSSGLSITTDGLYVHGAGIGQTVITSSASINSMIYYSVQHPSSQLPFRLSAMTLNGGNGTVIPINIHNDTNGTIWTKLRIDHIKILNSVVTSGNIITNGQIYGVIDHDSIWSTVGNLIQINGAENYSWLDPLDINGDDYLFVEDCFLSDHTNTDGTITIAHGGRVVIRNSILANRPRVNIHGNGSSGTTASGTHTGSNGAATLTDAAKSWTTNAYATGYYVLVNHTDSSTTLITANTATTATGTLGGGTRNNWNDGDAYTISPWNNPHGVVSTQVYNNIWYDTVAVNGLDARSGTTICFNNKIYSTLGIGNITFTIREEDANPAIGAVYPICRTYPGYDPIINSYFWSDSLFNADPYRKMDFYAGDGVASHQESKLITEQQDYWTDIRNYTQATGYFAYGTYANRPASPSDQDCYYATDLTKLYRSVGANNWTYIYKPYTYPHPLVGGGGTTSSKICRITIVR